MCGTTDRKLRMTLLMWDAGEREGWIGSYIVEDVTEAHCRSRSLSSPAN